VAGLSCLNRHFIITFAMILALIWRNGTVCRHAWREAPVPPSCIDRHRCYGVLAPNAPLRDAVTALAPVPGPVAGTPAAAPHRAAAR
jgi:hypothetical protein